MKKWKMRFTPEVSRLVAKLHPENKGQLKQALNGLRQNPFIGKDLQEELFGLKSLRLKNTGLFTRLAKKQIISKSIT